MGEGVLIAPRARGQVALAVLALLASVVTATAERPLYEGWSGVEVTAVELRTDREPANREELWTLVTVRAGEPLGAEAVRSSLRNLHASGEVGEAEAWVLPEPGGVRVVLSARLKLRVAQVRIEGQTVLETAELRRRLPQRPGEPLIESRVVAGVYRLQDLYAERGFPEAAVRVAVAIDSGSGTATLTYRVDAGQAALIESVTFDGPTEPFRPEELIAQLRSQPGSRYRREVARGDAERLEEWLLARGHRLASVERPRPGAGREPPAVTLRFPIRVGPVFDIRVVGGDAARLRRKVGVPLLLPERFDDALVAESVRQIRSFYQERGHYHVEVGVDERREADRVELTLTIEPGPVFELAEVSFSGNRWASGERLSQLLATSPRRLLGTGRLVDRELEADLANLRSFYALEGFRQARVGPARVELTGDRLQVTVPIEEGPRQLTASVALEGELSLPGERFAEALALAPGGPYHPRLLEESVAGLRALYEEEGFPSAQVEAAVEWNEAGTLAAATFRILEGPRALVDRVIVRGNLLTRTGMIRRVVGLVPGEVVNTRRLLRAQRRLLRLGVFSRADVRLGPAPPFTERRDLIVRVEEGRRNRVGYGLGWDSEDGPRGLLRLSRLNLGGRAITARLDLRVSDRDEQARVVLQQPYLGRWQLPTTFSLFSVEEREESFDSIRRGVQVRADRVRQGSELRLLATFKKVEVENADPALRPIEIDRELREVDLAIIGPGLLIDRRDDPIAPRRGWTFSLQAERAVPLLSARARFLKLFTQQTAYLPLGAWGVVAVSFRAGAIEPIAGGGFEDPTIPPGLPSRDVPISERLFAGGRTTHRAYKRDRLGILGETLLFDPRFPGGEDGSRPAAVGGNGLLLLNVDYRFPLAGPLEGAVFADAGNVWADWRGIDPGQAKGGVGLGLRYLSPIGPVRMEVGWKLDRELGEPGTVVFLSFGNPF